MSFPRDDDRMNRKDVADPRVLTRERLLAQDAENPALRADYERKLNAMLEVPLSRTRRVSLALVAVGAVATAGLVVSLLLTESMPWRARSGLGAGVAFAAAWTVYAVRILRRGTYRRKADSTTAAGMAYLFTLVMAVLFALLQKDPDPFVTVCFLFLLPAAVILLRTVVEQAELRTQERLLELEYRLARLGETAPSTGPGNLPGSGRP